MGTIGRTEGTLHAANVIVSTVGVAVAETALTGLSAGMTGLLSAVPVVRLMLPRPPTLDQRVGAMIEQALATASDLPPEAGILIPQMIVAGALTPDEIMGAARNPERIARAMLGKLSYAEYADPAMQRAFVAVVAPVFRTLLGDRTISDELRPSFENAVAASLAHIQRVVEQLLAQSGNTAREFGIKEGMLIALARRYATPDARDFDTALAGLEKALEVAHANRDRLPANTDAAVNDIIARVDALNDEGRLDAGWQTLQAALAAHDEEDARRAQAKGQMLAKGIDQSRMRNDPGTAAALELKRWRLDGGGFGDLRKVQDGWYERGRDKGLAFDLQVSIALARISVDRAQNPDERGEAFNFLGMALQTLGEREGITLRLEQAVTAYRAALENYTLDRAPLNWCCTQNNLGNALALLGEYQGSRELLEQSVIAYRRALAQWRRDAEPLDWASTQNNLGIALLILGEQETSTLRLNEAVNAYRAALEEVTQYQFPQNWAAIQNNLGIALRTLGERERSTEKIELATACFRKALAEYTRDRLPMDWASTQKNLGNALRSLGERESGIARLEMAVEAYSAALEEYTPDRVLLHWAGTIYVLGYTEALIGGRMAERDRVQTGIAQIEHAIPVLEDGGHAVWAERARNALEQARAILAGLPGA